MNKPELAFDKWPVDELVPHGEPMVLLDSIVSATADTLVGVASINSSSPFYAGGSTIGAWWAIEYMAQAIAALSGLRDRLAGRDVPIGFLTSCRRFECSGAAIKVGARAQVSVAESVAMVGSLAVFNCEFRADDFSAAAVVSVYSSGGDINER
jgi:predicted hotdog family 3-hydroxylacyl-ACP dehydratase